MIYRELRNLKSPNLPPDLPKNMVPMGYCSHGFHWQILATNQFIRDEATQIFYSDNDWTFFVSTTFPFDFNCFMLSPLASTLHLIRRIHIRFKMFDWLFMLMQGIQCGAAAGQLQHKVTEVCKILARARSLQSVKILWTETADIYARAIPDSVRVSTSLSQKAAVDIMNGATVHGAWGSPSISRMAEVDIVHGAIMHLMQPLAQFPNQSNLQRSEISVNYTTGPRSAGAEVAFSECTKAMETAFSNCIDAVIDFRRSNTKSTESCLGSGSSPARFPRSGTLPSQDLKRPQCA